jgi:CRP-like cAMP-binding protein
MDLMPNIHFSKDQIIFDEGYPAESVFLVCDGNVQIFKKREGENLTLAKLSKDAIFGEMALISDRPRSASVRALDDVWCYSITKDTFLQRLKNTDPLIVTIFHDLVDTIRAKSNAALLVDQGQIKEPPVDELQLASRNIDINSITPQHSREYVTKDPHLKQKVEMMDIFMRKLFYSLVNVAYTLK